jgi:hypothetical protein
MEERVAIEVGIARGDTDEEMAVRLGRHRSTIWREIAGNVAGDRDRYQAAKAQARADRQGRRPKATKLATDSGLAKRVASKLKIRWSPHAIAAWLLKVASTVRVCAETIYRAVYATRRRRGWRPGRGSCWCRVEGGVSLVPAPRPPAVTSWGRCARSTPDPKAPPTAARPATGKATSSWEPGTVPPSPPWWSGSPA